MSAQCFDVVYGFDSLDGRPKLAIPVCNVDESIIADGLMDYLARPRMFIRVRPHGSEQWTTIRAKKATQL